MTEAKQILSVEIEEWQELMLISDLMPGYVFRGQADARWDLSTKMERTCCRNDYPTDSLDNREEVMLKEFQRRTHHYLTDLPQPSERLEWYALLQHYGGSTRLLDFTKSLYVAAFFAMENADSDAAIWALNEDYLYQHIGTSMSASIMECIENDGPSIYEIQERSRKCVEKNLSHDHCDRLVMAAEPERLNERISIQQGLFVIPGDINVSFMENLAASFLVEVDALKKFMDLDPVNLDAVSHHEYLENAAVKIILRIDMHNSAMFKLASMNINASTLFPGIEGFSRSLDSYLRDVV